MTTALEPGLSTGYLEFQRRPEPMLGLVRQAHAVRGAPTLAPQRAGLMPVAARAGPGTG